jgi:hypothetical protein
MQDDAIPTNDFSVGAIVSESRHTGSTSMAPAQCGRISPPKSMEQFSSGACTDLNSVCYNSFTGQGQLLWVGVCL